MSLVKRGNSKFWYVQFQIDHQTIVRSTKTTDRRIAEQVAAKIRADVHAELLLGKKEQITLETALRRFANTKVGTANYRNLESQIRIIMTALDCSEPHRVCRRLQLLREWSRYEQDDKQVFT